MKLHVSPLHALQSCTILNAANGKMPESWSEQTVYTASRVTMQMLEQRVYSKVYCFIVLPL